MTELQLAFDGSILLVLAMVATTRSVQLALMIAVIVYVVKVVLYLS